MCNAYKVFVLFVVVLVFSHSAPFPFIFTHFFPFRIYRIQFFFVSSHWYKFFKSLALSLMTFSLWMHFQFQHYRATMGSFYPFPTHKLCYIVKCESKANRKNEATTTTDDIRKPCGNEHNINNKNHKTKMNLFASHFASLKIRDVLLFLFILGSYGTRILYCIVLNDT